MSFADALARLEQAVFDRLGEDATWAGVDGTVRVRWREADEEIGFTHGSSIVTGNRIKVRKSDVPAPEQGNVVQLLASDDAFIVASEPKLDRKGVWVMDVTPV